MTSKSCPFYTVSVLRQLSKTSGTLSMAYDVDDYDDDEVGKY